MKTYKGKIDKLPDNGIFVFGSNTQGRHGKGAALIAKQKFGAIYGKSQGLMSQSYGIITKDLTKMEHPSISKKYIHDQINDLYNFAKENPNKDFYIAYSGNGTNLNNYTNQEMATLFFRLTIPENIVFEEEFAKLIESRK